MGKKKKKTAEATPDIAHRVSTDNSEQNKTFVVVREGFRVSDKEYESEDDSEATKEKEFWEKVSKNHSWGEPVQIVQYDNKLHRIW